MANHTHTYPLYELAYIHIFCILCASLHLTPSPCITCVLCTPCITLHLSIVSIIPVMGFRESRSFLSIKTKIDSTHIVSHPACQSSLSFALVRAGKCRPSNNPPLNPQSLHTAKLPGASPSSIAPCTIVNTRPFIERPRRPLSDDEVDI